MVVCHQPDLEGGCLSSTRSGELLSVINQFGRVVVVLRHCIVTLTGRVGRLEQAATAPGEQPGPQLLRVGAFSGS